MSPALQSHMSWLGALRLYLGAILAGNLIWEFAQMPLYTIWTTDSLGEIFFAALHCTGGDVLISLSALTAALVFVGDRRWPSCGFWQVAATAGAIGLGYTIFSEWLNVEVRGAWAYADVMPLVPVIGAGLSPLVQWIAVPALSFLLIRRRMVRARRPALQISGGHLSDETVTAVS